MLVGVLLGRQRAAARVNAHLGPLAAPVADEVVAAGVGPVVEDVGVVAQAAGAESPVKAAPVKMASKLSPAPNDSVLVP